jgi:hypothetical protein
VRELLADADFTRDPIYAGEGIRPRVEASLRTPPMRHRHPKVIKFTSTFPPSLPTIDSHQKVTLRKSAQPEAEESMPNRTKHEAQLRLDIGMAQVLLKQGKSSREMLEAFRDHYALVMELENPQAAPDHAAQAPKTVERL